LDFKISILLRIASSVASMGFDAASTALLTALVCAGTGGLNLRARFQQRRGGLCCVCRHRARGTEVVADILLCTIFVSAVTKSGRDIAGMPGTTGCCCTDVGPSDDCSSRCGCSRCGAEGPALPRPVGGVGREPFALPATTALPAVAGTFGEVPPRCGRTGFSTAGKFGTKIDERNWSKLFEVAWSICSLNSCTSSLIYTRALFNHTLTHAHTIIHTNANTRTHTQRERDRCEPRHFSIVHTRSAQPPGRSLAVGTR
jgi:hypothetical protein